MNDHAIFALVEWANSLKGTDLDKLPGIVRSAVIYEQKQQEMHRIEAHRDSAIVKMFCEHILQNDE